MKPAAEALLSEALGGLWAPLPRPSAAQCQAMRLIAGGRDTFVCGPAGSGKSTLIRFARALARADGGEAFVCAPTGAAAANVQGETWHKALGLQPTATMGRAFQTAPPPPPTLRRLAEARLFVVDEASMLSAAALRDTLEALGWVLRQQGRRPQLLLLGDVHQAAPVAGPSGGEEEARHCFDSVDFFTVFPPSQCVRLCVTHRQRGEGASEFNEQMAALRRSHLGEAERKRLLHYLRRFERVAPGGALELHGRCSRVMQANLRGIDRMRDEAQGRFFTLKARYERCAGATAEQQERLEARARAPEKLHLCEGMPVELTSNLEPAVGLARGARARISVLREDKDKPGGYLLRLRLDSGEEHTIGPDVDLCFHDGPDRRVALARQQFPLKPAFARTVHSAQSASMHGPLLICSVLRAPGLVYTALTRVVDPERDLYIENAGRLLREHMPSEAGARFEERLDEALACSAAFMELSEDSEAEL